MNTTVQKILSYPKTLIVTLFTIALTLTAGCSSTAEFSKIRLEPTKPMGSPNFRLVDAREQDTLIYSKEGNTQYFGDSNFETPPVQIIAARFNEKLGGLLKGKEITLLHFRARITDPDLQTYPGMPIAAEILGKALKLPQLGYPHYAGVSLRGSYQQKEFTGDESVQFYLGSGESETSEAFNAAVSKAATNLQLLLMNEKPAPN